MEIYQFHNSVQKRKNYNIALLDLVRLTALQHEAHLNLNWKSVIKSTTANDIVVSFAYFIRAVTFYGNRLTNTNTHLFLIFHDHYKRFSVMNLFVSS